MLELELLISNYHTSVGFLPEYENFAEAMPRLKLKRWFCGWAVKDSNKWNERDEDNEKKSE